MTDPRKILFDALAKPIKKKGIDYILDKLESMGVTRASKYQKNLGATADDQVLSALTLKNLREQKIAEAIKHSALKKEEYINIFDPDMVQTPPPETNFTLDQVPNSSKVINPDSGEVEILVGKKAYPIDQVIMNQGQHAKYFTLKQSPYLKKVKA